jgi:DNA polymerase III delta subunit
MYRKLIEASEIRGAMNGWQAARTLGMRPEQADIALRAARKTSKAQLLSGLRALEKADDRLKSSKDSRMVLEFLVTELTNSNAQYAYARRTRQR